MNIQLTARFAPRGATPSSPMEQSLHDLLVECTLTNTGKTTIPFGEWNCSWDKNWFTTSVKLRLPGINCSMNFVVPHSLKPGESYRKCVPLCLMDKIKPGERVEFRMRFVSQGMRDQRVEYFVVESDSLVFVVPNPALQAGVLTVVGAGLFMGVKQWRSRR
ncbi:hypothetical protein [Armatimonas sp.]|uniref:hypothetical protein n=1 Tax=Armatimonas sp. TaxID=1872638 RepID=UPI00286C17B1|nr:hypothetical protein [Armatimonas sp.]